MRLKFEMSHGGKMLSNCTKYINELNNMLSISQDADNAKQSITLSSLDNFDNYMKILPDLYITQLLNPIYQLKL